MEEPAIREKSGKFVKGVSGNPTGRKPIPPEIKEALTSLVPKAVERLTEIIHSSTNEKIVMQAVEVVFNRVYGKPQQALDIESNNNTTLKVVLTEQLKEWAK
jgi:hypothetical protein